MFESECSKVEGESLYLGKTNTGFVTPGHSASPRTPLSSGPLIPSALLSSLVRGDVNTDLGSAGEGKYLDLSLADQNRQCYGNKIPNAKTQNLCRENCSEPFFGCKHLLDCKRVFHSGLIFLMFE